MMFLNVFLLLIAMACLTMLVFMALANVCLFPAKVVAHLIFPEASIAYKDICEKGAVKLDSMSHFSMMEITSQLIPGTYYYVDDNETPSIWFATSPSTADLMLSSFHDQFIKDIRNNHIKMVLHE